MALFVNITVFYGMTTCLLVTCYRCFGEACSLCFKIVEEN
jgi:hypothetical protein